MHSFARLLSLHFSLPINYNIDFILCVSAFFFFHRRSNFHSTSHLLCVVVGLASCCYVTLSVLSSLCSCPFVCATSPLCVSVMWCGQAHNHCRLSLLPFFINYLLLIIEISNSLSCCFVQASVQQQSYPILCDRNTVPLFRRQNIDLQHRHT